MKIWFRYAAGKLRAGVEAHAERRDVRAEALRGRDELAHAVLACRIPGSAIVPPWQYG